MKELFCTVKSNSAIARGIFAMTITLPEEVQVRGGQFLNISTGNPAHLLKRPFGIMRKDGCNITFCYQLKGEGTMCLSKAKAGDKLAVTLPLGNGFVIPDGAKKIAVVGGGVGIFPLLSVIESVKGREFYSYIGFRGAEYACLIDDFKAASKQLTVVTDDGSIGAKTNAVSAFLSEYEEVLPHLIISCGPPVMLRALKSQLKERGISTPCLVSLEERMGCGIGACLVCVCKKSDGSNARVCKDGPVFDINEVEL